MISELLQESLGIKKRRIHKNETQTVEKESLLANLRYLKTDVKERCMLCEKVLCYAVG